jgi:2-polyprenyl-3-methyl-5-hydroxy-6-metoxy-1,4-benzoquinol methylase
MKREQYQRFEKVLDFLLRRDWSLLRRFIYNKVYDDAFYDETREMKAATFRSVAEILDRRLTFQSVFDIGCGAGQLLRAFAQLGKQTVGCEISEAGIRQAGNDLIVFQADAGQRILLSRHFDLVTCIEVAEHLDRRNADRLVENCTTYAEQVFFTAAVEGQVGVGHINLQPRRFWVDLFEKRGFSWQQAVSEQIRQEMRDAEVVSWIVENMMVFSRPRYRPEARACR